MTGRRRARARGPGRPSGSSSGESRGAILAAARELFARRGFRQTTTRAIAARAGVDPALVHYFFHSKAKLFAAAVELPIAPLELQALLAQALGGARRGGAGATIVRAILEQVFAARGEQVAALIRSAVGDPGSVPSLRALIEQTVVAGAARVIPGPSARLRAELLGALLVGLFVVRQLVRVEPLASSSPEEVAALVGPALDALLGVRSPSGSRGSGASGRAGRRPA